MEDTHNSIFPCFPCLSFLSIFTKKRIGAIQLPADEKPAMDQQYTSQSPISPLLSHPQNHSSKQEPPSRLLSTSESASRIVSTLLSAHKAGPSLNAEIASLVHQTAGGWSQYLAAKILSALEAVLTAKPVREMNGAMKDAFKKACDAAKVIEGFAAEHPLATAACVTIIAIGILVVLTPYVVEWLGFAELGPVEGSWAAAWQSTYRGFVPKRSLFSFFQRLGMKWKH